jgi:hypothetical protein
LYKVYEILAFRTVTGLLSTTTPHIWVRDVATTSTKMGLADELEAAFKTTDLYAVCVCRQFSICPQSDFL